MAAATRSAAQDSSATKPESSPTSQDKKAPVTSKEKKTDGGDETKTSAPLAPPPKPSGDAKKLQTPDFFSGGAGGSHFSLEPNPFEQSFGNPAAETPGKFGGLPSVASLTSPAPLGAGGTPGWSNSLRSGPLSPAMLTGPTNNGGGYFDSEFRGSFPTPNESSLRTGLTPGGGGSMFPAPSPNSQAIFSSLQAGGATPGTLDFHRTAMSAAARSKVENPAVGSNNLNSSSASKTDYQPAQQHASDPFSSAASQPENDAVNSLYMLANNSNRAAPASNNQFSVPAQPLRTHTKNGSIGGVSNATDEGDTKPSKKGKKGAAAKATPGNRRKADDVGPKGGNKRAKIDIMPDDFDDDEDDEEDDGSQSPPGGGSGKTKMTDDEKRRNFLERNRVAALKCRQRKKQWLANLQQKVEIFSSENDALTAQCAQMRDEIHHLKQLLYAHKDCPIAHQQGLGGNNMAQVLGAFDGPPHGFGMGLPNGQALMAGGPNPSMQRK